MRRNPCSASTRSEPFPRAAFSSQSIVRFGRSRLSASTVPLPANEAEVRGLLREHLPSGFIREPDFGLGIEKEFGSIITSIEKLDGVTSLVLTNQRETGRDKSIFFLTFDDFEDIRLAMARITRRYQAEGRADRAI